MEEKRKHREHLDELTENPSLSLDPPSLVSRHLKWTGVTISQYFGQASSASSTSSPSITQQQLADIIGGLKDEIQKEGSCAESEAKGLPKEPSDVGVDLMGLYVVNDQSTMLVALGKVYDNSSTIHTVPYVDDVTRKAPPKSVGSLERGTVGGAIDPLGELVKNLFMNDWSTSIGFAKVYGFLKPQSILRAKDRHEECKQYIETWVKESHREVYFGPYLNQKSLDVHIKACNEETTTLKGKADRPTPRWIEAKSHVQVGAYECGYYVMHWMWCIVSGSLKNEWNKWLSNGTSLDKDTMTTLRKEWATYFLQVQKMDVTQF
ncbi:hypothetical protein GmHk_09G025998 [Glycine max]|nr:hypothetical protein GmHk_09G025998 [Glycine max]